MQPVINKEIKNASECIVELYKHAGIFKNTREVHREARGAVARCLPVAWCSHKKYKVKRETIFESGLTTWPSVLIVLYSPARVLNHHTKEK